MNETDRIIEAALARKKRMEAKGNREKHLSLRKSGKKNHSTSKEKSYDDRTKARKAKLKIESNNREAEAYKQKAQAYWRGDSDEHP